MDDFEVLGLGGWKQKELIERPREEGDLTLRIHPAPFHNSEAFAAALNETLDWLKPTKLEHEIWPAERWAQQLESSARALLPESFRLEPDEAARLIKSYNAEKPLEDFLFVEHYRMLPAFLRRQKLSDSLHANLSFEITKHLLESRDFGKLTNQKGFLTLNPTLHVFDNTKNFIKELGAAKIFVLYVHPESLRVQARELTQTHAGLMDFVGRLQEDEAPLASSAEGFRREIDNLVSEGLILKNL